MVGRGDKVSTPDNTTVTCSFAYFEMIYIGIKLLSPFGSSIRSPIFSKTLQCV